MSKSKIPQYHPSYTEEENQQMYEYLETASTESLVQSLWDLCNLYPPEEKENVINALCQFNRELSERMDLEQRYQELMTCRDLWIQYRNALEIYPDILKIRKKYDEYKEAPGKRPYGVTMLEAFLGKYKDTVCDGYSDEMVRRFLLKDKNYEQPQTAFYDSPAYKIKNPQEPIFYDSIESIPIKHTVEKKVLENLGKENLKYLITILLQYVDVTGNQNPADVILIFLNRKYASSQASHKKQPGLFATKTMNIQQLKENCQRLLVEIEELKEQSQILANELQEFIKKMKNEQK